MKANTETPCSNSPDQPLHKPKASTSTNISITLLLSSRIHPTAAPHPRQPLQYSIHLLPVLTTAFHSHLVTHPHTSPYIHRLQSLPVPLCLTTELLMLATDVGLSFYGLCLVSQRADFDSWGQTHRFQIGSGSGLKFYHPKPISPAY